MPHGVWFGGNKKQFGAGGFGGGAAFLGHPQLGKGCLVGPLQDSGSLGSSGEVRGDGGVQFTSGVLQAPLLGVLPALVVLQGDLGLPQDFGGHHDCFGCLQSPLERQRGFGLPLYWDATSGGLWDFLGLLPIRALLLLEPLY